ncbi:MAG: tetraprenyl-beta-curcumene synthase family protein [Bacillota bacterium]|nr:tetraprenyl-beta-curcumene synthase family protein [Clostridia bacterium]
MYQTWNQVKTIYSFVKDIFPLVDKELDYWREQAAIIPDQVLRTQALASIKTKRFHCQGGSVFALFPGVKRELLVRFIVAFQTISDYLDNLCDRAGCQDEKAFRQLHRAITEALSPDSVMSDYYAYYPYRDDGGYLKFLVQECRKVIGILPSYRFVQQETGQLGLLYSELQSLKHIPKNMREEKIAQWTAPYLKVYKNISLWEFAAATGSTLAIFMLCTGAFDPALTKEQVDEIIKAYFPYVCGLHILLDYFIDQEEDYQEGDLNFVFYYRDHEERQARLTFFLEESLSRVAKLPFSYFHVAVIEGLLALYLSDQKASGLPARGIGTCLIRTAGKRTIVCYQLCRLLRKTKVI